MEVEDDVEEDDMDFNPFLREGSPSETSSSLTSEAECEEHNSGNRPSETYMQDSVDNENTTDTALPQNALSSKDVVKEIFPEKTSTQVNTENEEGRLKLDGLEKEVLPGGAACSPTVQNPHHLFLEASEEDAICRRTRARYSLANYALEELETFLQESDDDGDLQNVDEEEEYRKFLAAVLSGVNDDTQACQGDENQDEDDNDADFELEIEEALESDGDENAENYDDTNGRKEKDGRRPHTRQRRPFTELPGAGSYRHESNKTHLRPILPYVPTAVVTPAHAFGWQYPSQNTVFPSPPLPTFAPLVCGFTDQQLGQLHVLIYEHVQLLIQTFSLCVLDPSKQDVASNVKKMIVDLVGSRDQALDSSAPHRHIFFEPQHLTSSLLSAESTECQWMPLIKSPVVSILDVAPLQLALSYLSDVATAVVKYRKSHVDGTADKNRRKEPLFPSPVINSCKQANNISQDRSNSAPTASSGKLQQKKSLAATLLEGTKKETVALVPADIARLAQRFFSLFNFALFPHKPPPAAMANRVLFTDAEDRLLALGIQEYNNDWGAIQKRFLPCKSNHQIFVRQKNRSSSKAPDNPVKEVRRLKTSPLTAEEMECIQEGLRIFKNDWTSVWRFAVPHRDPSLLQRQWRVASGVQKSYTKSDAEKERRRSYEAKRRKLRASMPDPPIAHEADNNASDDVENDDDSYVNEAFLEDTDSRSTNMMPCQLSLPRNAGKSMTMQSGTGLDEECGATGGYIETQKGSGMKLDVTTSYIPFMYCPSDVPSYVRAPSTIAPVVSCGSLDQLQVSQMSKEKGSRVVKLAPDLPPVNLPPSVRVLSQVAFHPNLTHFHGTSDNATKDMYPLPPINFTESVYRQLNLFPDHRANSRLQHNGISNENTTEDGAEQDLQMHPLLFQHPRDVVSSYSRPVQNLINQSRKYDLFPFEKVQVESSNNQTTGSTENGTLNANTIDFHPLLQRTEVEVHDEVPEDNYRHSVNQSEYNMNEAPTDDQSTPGQASTSPSERETSIDLNIHLCSPMEIKDSNDLRGAFGKSNVQDEVYREDRASVPELEVENSCSHHCIQEPNEESMQGIVMEQEELSDSEEDSQHVEFECEEMDDSEEEQVQGPEASPVQNKGISASVICEEFHVSNDQSQIQQGSVQMDKQGASSMQKLQAVSSRSTRAKLKLETAKRTGSRANQRPSSSRTTETSRSKTRSSKQPQGQSSAERKPNDSRRNRKTPAPR